MQKNSRLAKKSRELFSKIGADSIESLGFHKLLWYLNPINTFFMWLFPPKISEQGVYVAYFRRRIPARELVNLWIFGWLLITSDGKMKFVWKYSPTNSALDAYLTYDDCLTSWMEPLPDSVYRSMRVDKIRYFEMIQVEKKPKTRTSRLIKTSIRLFRKFNAWLEKI